MIIKYCPFIKDLCREDCVFRHRNVATSDGIYSCLIAIKLSEINAFQSDELNHII